MLRHKHRARTGKESEWKGEDEWKAANRENMVERALPQTECRMDREARRSSDKEDRQTPVVPE